MGSIILKNLFSKIQKCWYYKKDGYYYKCMALLYEIFAELSNTDSSYLSSKTYHQISPAIDYIDHHFTESKIDCDYLAELCNISQSYMIRLFKKHFGMPPNNYITSKKIQYACDLINTKCYSVGTIAEMCGFVNCYYFSKVFKKHTGVNPSKWVERNR